ncbi:Alcohol dehydrogenase GroES domain protein [Catenulispora acidiphila DSM 44928]|uniref:Alcohol dehydrogenase GroES domain protein n=1 Tax=Catenulispora acidiphila (strain DSM 44928 / JCM 14897 / NBRC 102108 / NRRL B-24433 / ID139908) TaxID=479433 RepID=C7PVC7_CATAD|nr:NADP-dependent oxidoreductase [Catenulispora acidiphila]ACU69283.1 Alcohol dehydrogenase GroES domain protein [Catenulispora acidiphila DSM 44928]
MADRITPPDTMRTVRFREYGEPADVLRLEIASVPAPSPGRIRIAVHACGLAPADWALCRGLFAGDLPRGIGCDVAGTVEAVGEGVTDVAIGDPVFGTADYAGQPSAGAADHAIMDHWYTVPEGLDLIQAAALPMALSTAYWHLTRLGLSAGSTLLVNGAGTTIGYAAVQIALHRGLHVIATAGETYAPQLKNLGATVTAYGDGLPDRVAALSDTPIDIVFDTAPPNGALPDLIRIADDDPQRILTCSDLATAPDLGARDTFHEDRTTFTDADRFSHFPEFAHLAAKGKFTVPVAGTFPLDQWRTALDISQSGHARGKLLLLPGSQR